MRRSARIVAFAAALVTTVLSLAAPVAAAESQYDYRGGCGFRGSPGEQQQVTGVLYVLAAVYSAEALQNVAPARITCSINVNGVDVSSASYSGTGVVSGIAPASYVASEVDIVEVCETVDLPDTAVDVCHLVESLVPQPVQDAFAEAFDTAVQLVGSLLTDVADPLMCPVLVGLAGDFGPVAIRADGDVHVVGDPVWDCPPYGEARFPPRLMPPYYAGGITISNHGLGLVWQRTGVLATSSWSCSMNAAAVTVTCSWVGGPVPKCRTSVVSAAVFPTLTSSGGMVWGMARARSTCDFLTLDTGVATGSTGNQFKWNGLSWAPPLATAWTVRCRADDGSNGLPVAQYVADCDWIF